MKSNTAKTKQLLSIYISKDLVDKIKDEAEKKHRKISGQVEMMLCDWIDDIGVKLDTQENFTNGTYNKRLIGAVPLPRPQDSR